MVRLKTAALLAVASMSVAATAQAETLAIDFQPTGGVVEAGFQAYEETNQVLPGVAGTDYTAFGSTVNIALSVANLPDDASDFRAVTRNGAAAEKENDWIGVDTRDSGTDVTLDVIVSGLPAGSYSWSSTHHDGGTGTTSGNLNGSADYSLTDASGTVTVADGVTISQGNVPEPISTLGLNLVSDGNPITFSMIMDNGQGSGPNDNNALFALIGSVEITAIPEPSTMALCGLGLAGWVMIRCWKQPAA